MIITTYPVYQTGTGEQFIQCTYQHEVCGCRVVGGGTLQQPLKIQYCKRHEPIEVAIIEEKLKLAKLDIGESKDQLHRRNMQIRELKNKFKDLQEALASPMPRGMRD